MSRLATIATIAATLIPLSCPARASSPVGCPNGANLSGTEVISGDPNASFPVEQTPDKIVATGPDENTDYTSETWTLLSEMPQPLTLRCRYGDGSVTTYALPSGTTTCTYYLKPQRAMACQ